IEPCLYINAICWGKNFGFWPDKTLMPMATLRLSRQRGISRGSRCLTALSFGRGLAVSLARPLLTKRQSALQIVGIVPRLQLSLGRQHARHQRLRDPPAPQKRGLRTLPPVTRTVS